MARKGLLLQVLIFGALCASCDGGSPAGGASGGRGSTGGRGAAGGDGTGGNASGGGGDGTGGAASGGRGGDAGGAAGGDRGMAGQGATGGALATGGRSASGGAGSGGSSSSGGNGGIAGGGGRGGSGGAAGATGHVCKANTPTGVTCTAICEQTVCCGSACCRPAEWCDTGGPTPVCRCGSGGACTGADMCSAPVFDQNTSCGVVCCSGTNCPKSRRGYKRDIELVTPEGLQGLYRQLREIQLTTYQYKDSPVESPRRLGFIIDDTKSTFPVNTDGNTVDLYGYLSMAVAAIQVQSREIESLRAEVTRLGRSKGHLKSVAGQPGPFTK